MSKTRIGVVLSGTGRTLTNLLETIGRGELDAEVVCVVSDREGVRGVELAKHADLPTVIAAPADTFDILEAHGAELCCLCGYLRLLTIPQDWQDRTLNIHPSLLPKFGGQGFYGHRVHEAVIASDDTESGCTVHCCNNEYDRGPILLQKRVPVLPDDDADRLADRVFEAECLAYPEAIRMWTDARA